MSSAQVPAPVYTDDAIVGWQSNSRGGGLLRSRIPTGVINATQAQDGEYYHYEVYDTDRPFTIEIPAGTTIIAYPIAAADAKPRNVIEEKKAQKAAKATTSTKGASKRGAKKGGVALDDDVFGGEEEYEDDGSEPVQQAPAARKAGPANIASRQAPAARQTPAQPAASSRIAQRPASIATSPRQPRREGAILKPSQQAGGRRGVRYNPSPEGA